MIEKKNYDVVEQPEHYTSSNIECIDAMEEALGTKSVIDFCRGNAFKYIWRSDKKNGLEDLKKARWYINKAIELEEKLSTN